MLLFALPQISLCKVFINGSLPEECFPMVNFYYHCQRCQLEHENCLRLKAPASILVVVVASGANRFMFWEVLTI